MKISDDGWHIIFISLIVVIVALNMISLHWIHLWVSIGAIIGVYFILSPLLSNQKEQELDELYSEYHALCEELKLLMTKKRKSQR
jgi:hypothetical protein